jgi:hypothetical protein
VSKQTGSLNVLNVGAGDIKVVFNKENQDETAKAIKMLTDMQKRGYVIAIEMPDGTYERAVSIDATNNRYIINVPDEETALPPEAEVVSCACGCGGAVSPGKKWIIGHHRRKSGEHKVSLPVRSTKAYGIARSAGG